MGLSADDFCWSQKPLGTNDPTYEIVCTARIQSPHAWSTASTPLALTIPLRPMFQDEAAEPEGIFGDNPNDHQTNDCDNFVNTEGDLNANMDCKAKPEMK